ncbi:hypothetical protein [Crateriforma conspicua]|uniref:Uncharacterized protein n=1 Tax=Crateriforma conspicua TaxID=2527996 RepID=A0A5C5Y2F5_9PLAN|nr:hypothetical protein [Crateriforma conspicua]TWT68989.1 hypothetical protein Pan14r_12730 [Crateriforma conspicua]
MPESREANLLTDKDRISRQSDDARRSMLTALARLLAVFVIATMLATVLMWLRNRSPFLSTISQWMWVFAPVSGIAEQIANVVTVQIVIAALWPVPRLLRWYQWLTVMMVIVGVMGLRAVVPSYPELDYINQWVMALMISQSQLLSFFLSAFVMAAAAPVVQTHLVARNQPMVLPKRQWTIAGIMAVTLLTASVFLSQRVYRTLVEWYWDADAIIDSSGWQMLFGYASYIFPPVLIAWAAAFRGAGWSWTWAILLLLFAWLFQLAGQLSIMISMEANNLFMVLGISGVHYLVANGFAFLVHRWCFRRWHRAGYDLWVNVRWAA